MAFIKIQTKQTISFMVEQTIIFAQTSIYQSTSLQLATSIYRCTICTNISFYIWLNLTYKSILILFSNHNILSYKYKNNNSANRKKTIRNCTKITKSSDNNLEKTFCTICFSTRAALKS